MLAFQILGTCSRNFDILKLIMFVAQTMMGLLLELLLLHKHLAIEGSTNLLLFLQL